MSSVLVVETEDFAQAAVTLQQRAAEPVSRALGTLTAVLEGCGSMAGSDPGGQDWASSYDRAAQAALRAQADAVNGCYRLALLFAQSARNYEHADLASSPSRADRHAVIGAAARVSGPTSLFFSPSLPSAAGGSGGGPPGWAWSSTWSGTRGQTVTRIGCAVRPTPGRPAPGRSTTRR
ncbi:MAG TPA: hypothetical protein VFU35_05875 [Jatrophihabitans sp.]|nr:hypothetical protein [Jatrophihabitans sp.]